MEVPFFYFFVYLLSFSKFLGISKPDQVDMALESCEWVIKISPSGSLNSQCKIKSKI